MLGTFAACDIESFFPTESPSGTVEVVGVTVKDSTGGNNNGKLNPGETVALFLDFKNTGPDTIPASEAGIFSSQQGIRILDSTIAFPEIAPGDTVSSLDALVITAADSFFAPRAEFGLEAVAGASYRAVFSVQNNISTYACINSCTVIRGRKNNAGGFNVDTLLISLSLCNQWTDTTFVLDIASASLILCSFPNISFTPITQKVFYGRVNKNTCGDPSASCTKVFRFTFTSPLGNAPFEDCLRLTAHIWVKAILEVNCDLPVPTLVKPAELCDHVIIPGRNQIPEDE
jgi:hypothetical protein